MALFAGLLALAAYPAGDDGRGFEQCVESTLPVPGWPACYAAERDRLRGEQEELLAGLYHAFSRTGPDGTDRLAAAKALRRAQRHWHAYLKTDCAAFARAFGSEIAFGLPEGNCIVDHYRTRNAAIRDLSRSYRLPTGGTGGE